MLIITLLETFVKKKNTSRNSRFSCGFRSKYGTNFTKDLSCQVITSLDNCFRKKGKSVGKVKKSARIIRSGPDEFSWPQAPFLQKRKTAGTSAAKDGGKCTRDSFLQVNPHEIDLIIKKKKGISMHS